MTHRISKYSFNSYKLPTLDKNAWMILPGKKVITFWNLMGILFFNLNLLAGFMLHRKLVKENNILKENFENRKLRQIAFDFMIYSQSTKMTENSVDQLSLF